MKLRSLEDDAKAFAELANKQAARIRKQHDLLDECAATLDWYSQQMCEGFCKDLREADTYDLSMDDRCAGCKARATLNKLRAAQENADE